MSQNHSSASVITVEKNSRRPLYEGYQPERELTSAPPRGRSVSQNPVPEKSDKKVASA
jgi:hypothetical protein